jgi:hypothetical protein
MANANSLPEKMATTAQIDEIKAQIIRQNPKYDMSTVYAVLSGRLSVGVSYEAAERLIELGEMP